MSLLANSNAIESGGYNIDRSLRFRSSASAYLSRTPASAGNATTFTFSAWVKRGQIGSSNPTQHLFNGGTSVNTYVGFGQVNTDDISGNLRGSGGTNYFFGTSAVYRDPSAWYHIVWSVDTTQATSSNRVFVYVNGALQSLSTANYPPQNTALLTASARYIGQTGGGVYYFDGYLAEVNFIDGQALTPSSFGEFSTETGVWVPKKYTGTYGTNGFYLPFTDNTSPTTLGYDKSGNSNNWTANNISTTAGATYDSMTDVPTLTSATAANYCVLNPLASNVSGLAPQQGNLYWGNNATYNSAVTGTIGVSSGKWYWECKADSAYYFTGISAIPQLPANIAPHQATSQSKVYYSFSGQKYDNGSNAVYGATWGTADICGVALDMDAGTITFYKNNVSQGTAYSGLSGTYWPVIGGPNGVNTGYINFGQRPFSYTPPTGFKALNTFNLPDPTIKKPNQYMDATLYTGNGNPNNTTQTITNSGSMQPDFVWIKSRSNAYNNSLFDSVRGVANTLASNSTAAEDTTGTTMLTSLNSNGFTVGSNLNGSLGSTNVNGATYVGWQWKKGATPGFDIVTFTGTGAAQNISHSLGVAPSMMIVKQRGAVGDWWTYHKYANASPQNGALWLNLTNAWTGPASYWNNTAPTSSVFTVGTAGGLNANGVTQVAYLFAEIPGFSKFGSYTGNGSTDGPFVFTNFQPRYILIKQSSAAGEDWIVQDTARKPYNTSGTSTSLFPDSSSAEVNTAAQLWDVTSNGFKIRASGGGVNTNGATYIYAAFASNTFKFSTAF